MPQRARSVIAHHRLHRDPVGAGLDGHRHGLPVTVHADRHQQVRARGVGHPRHPAVERDLVAGAAHRGRGRPRESGLGLDRPGLLELSGGPRRHVDRAQLAGGDALQRGVTGGIEDRRGRQHPQQRHGGEHAAALLGHQQRVEAAQARAAVRLVDEHAGPPGLHGHRPQVRQRGRVLQGGARGLDRLDAGQRSARGFAQQHLLVGEGEVHDVTACFSMARSSLKGTPLSNLGSGGSPRTRSPIVLRSTCSVPPADFRPGRNEIR